MDKTSPVRRHDFSSQRLRVVYVPTSRVAYGLYTTTDGMFAIEGEPDRVRTFGLEPLVQEFQEMPPNLAESIRTEKALKIQAAHKRLVKGYDGSVLLGVYLIEGDIGLKVVPAVHDAFSNENGNLTLDKLTQRLAALKNVAIKEMRLPVSDVPAVAEVLYVAISKDYRAVQKYWDKVLAEKIPFTQPI